MISALLGSALIGAAIFANRRWFDRHVFLPFFFLRPVWITIPLRIGLATAGVAVWGTFHSDRRPSADEKRRSRPPSFRGAAALRGALALAMAGAAAEGILRWTKPIPDGPGYRQYELRVGRRDPLFGWTARPSQTTTLVFQGRPYSYAVNAWGFRAPRQTDEPDPSQPTLIVAGESIASGYGLDFDDTFAARCGRRLGLQVMDVAEGGYGVDQAYLRLDAALARTARPAIALMIVVPVYLGRALRDDRPRLILDDGGAPQWVPEASGFVARLRLRDLVHNRIPYLGDEKLRRALALVRQLLVASARDARAHGALPLFVVPSHGPDRPLAAHDEAWIVQALLADAALPFVLVDLDASMTFPGDGHPNARGSEKIAAAVTAELCALPGGDRWCPPARP